MHFLLDENVAGHTGIFLKSRGHRVERVPLGASDQSILLLAQLRRAVILTRDRDFLFFLPSPRRGIVYIQIHPSIAEDITLAVGKLVADLAEDRFFERTILLRKDGYEIFGE